MSTVTLEYNKHNPLARRKLAALLATGLFFQKEDSSHTPTPEEVEAHNKWRDALLEHSRQTMAQIVARHSRT